LSDRPSVIDLKVSRETLTVAHATDCHHVITCSPSAVEIRSTECMTALQEAVEEKKLSPKSLEWIVRFMCNQFIPSNRISPAELAEITWLSAMRYECKAFQAAMNNRRLLSEHLKGFPGVIKQIDKDFFYKPDNDIDHYLAMAYRITGKYSNERKTLGNRIRAVIEFNYKMGK